MKEPKHQIRSKWSYVWYQAEMYANTDVRKAMSTVYYAVQKFKGNEKEQSSQSMYIA